MKIICIFLLVSFPHFAVAQLSDGTKILTTSISNLSFAASRNFEESDNNPRVRDNNTGFQIWPEITYGRVKRNRLFSYGISLRYRHDGGSAGGDNDYYGVFPVVGYTYYYKIKDNLYLSPFTRFSVGYERSILKASSISSKRFGNTIRSSLAFNPIAISFIPNDKMIFFFGFSRIELLFERIALKTSPNLNNYRAVSSALTLNAHVNNFNFGFQKIL